MSNDKKGPQKPFLGADDLFSELDAWDATFDALHGGPDASSEQAAAPPAPVHTIEPAARAQQRWPQENTATSIDINPDPTQVVRVAPEVLDPEVRELDEQLTLDRATVEPELELEAGAPEAEPEAPAPTQLTAIDTFEPDPLETDFSALGADEAPVDDAPTRLHESGRHSRPPTVDVQLDEVEDEEVLTSASRPHAVAPPSTAYDDDDDALAPPPAPEPRRSPAILRRGPGSGQFGLREDIRATPPGGYEAQNQFGEEHTRIADVGEMEERAAASGRASRPTAPPPVEDDDYADIEIAAEAPPERRSSSGMSGIPDAPQAEPLSTSRRTAHVFRRNEATTRPPPPATTAAPAGSVIELDIDEDFAPPRAPTGSEDDFSDVAAAVGADDDLAVPSVAARPAAREITIAPSTPQQNLDDALDTLGDDDDFAAPVAPAGRPPTAPSGPTRVPPGPSVAPLPAPPPTPRTSPPTPPPRAPEPAFSGPSDTKRGVPPPAEAQRPPALTDLYPRVKTPTSVPPIGQAAPGAPMKTLMDFGSAPAARQSVAPAPPPAAIAESQAAAQGRAPIARLETVADLATAPEHEPLLDLDAVGRAWPEQLPPLPTTALDEASAQALLVYEREIATVDDSAASAALRIEAGRLCERLTDFDRARGHYDAALLADPRATAALRGLRRLARASGDLAEATAHLDAEIAVAGALERRPLGHYRVDLLMASSEQDMARVAVGEILDSAPSDVRALLAQLELAFLDGRADEFGLALDQLAHAVTDHELRAAALSARGALAAHHNDMGAAANAFAQAAESDPASLAARLGAVRQAAAENDGERAARALVDLARQVEVADPITAAAAALRAQQWAQQLGGGQADVREEITAAALGIANAAAGADPLVARLAAEAAAAGTDPAAAGSAFAHWAAHAAAPAERAYAAARAAELDPGRAAELWASALALDPGDDYAAAQLRTAHVTAEATQASIDVDLAIANDTERDRARLRAAYGMIAQGQLDDAIAVLAKGRAQRPASLALAEALGEALAAAGKWSDRAKLFAELAEEPGDQLDKDVAQLRSALAWEEAVGAAAALDDVEQNDELQRATAAALEAWDKVIERSSSPAAHAAAIVLASRLGDRDVINDVLARAQLAERAPWAAASLALRRARLVADDPPRAEAILRDAAPGLDDPRRTTALVVGAGRAKELGDAATALEDRAKALPPGARTEIAALRLRAAQLALDAGHAARATALLREVELALPQLGVVADLLAAARRRAGDRPTAESVRRREPTMPPPTGAAVGDAFARIVRDADLAASHNDTAAALALYQRALELRPGDPLAAVPLVRVATAAREPAPIAALALARLRVAEDSRDGVAKATAYELLAHIDGELRGDTQSAQMAIESASQADPTRVDLLHRLQRAYAAQDQLGELLRLRKAELDQTPAELLRDRTALLLDLAGLSERDGRPELELADQYRSVLDADPKTRLALLHLESIVRRPGFSPELAELEEKIAAFFEGDAKAQAAFWTRAGETLAELGRIDEAVQRFGKAEGALPGHVPALEGWRQAALKGQLWIDVAEAATRQAQGAPDPAQKAGLHHLAGVALMDKALVGDKAMTAFQRALDAVPGHKDAFLRLRILLEEDANHDDLATLLARRLDVETDPTSKIELHRALAELHRNFLSDRDTAKGHYRAILDSDPNDLRAHAAVADIAWEQGNWQEAADALMARARLERAPEVLKTLCFRLGLIYADRLVDVPMALKAFQRALTYQPDDENTLIRLADLATQIGEWKLALGACERLVKNETDPDRRAAHLHRVSKIFKQGFGDTKRAERALNLALDGAPTNDDALTALVQFYRDSNDMASVRVHLNRVTGAMRARVAADPLDGVAYRVISRAMAARAQANVPGSQPIAKAAAELAELLGASGEPEQKLLGLSQPADLSLLIRPEADEVIFPRGVQVELRQIFQILGDRIAKHVGVDLRPYGATRGDRLRARENPVAAVAQSVATGLGFGEIDVYISQRQPWAMVAEPTSPVSLVIGSAIAGAGGDAIRFAAGGALKLAQSSLAIPARLPLDELGVLVTALLRLFQPDFPIVDVEADAVAAQAQKLKRLIPTSLVQELKPFALAVDPQRFRHADLSRDLKIAGLRAGLVASGSLLAGLRILAAQAGGELPGFLADPVAQGLVSFALGEDHAVVAR